MSAKRPPTAPGARKTTAGKKPVKPAGKRAAPKDVHAAAAKPVAAQKSAPPRGAKALAKIKLKAVAKAGAKARIKPRVGAASKPSPPAASPDKVVEARTQRSAPGGVKARPRLRRDGARKRAGARQGNGMALARFAVGDVVRHKFYPFRGVVFDIDPVFANTDEWWLSIPEQMRPRKNQPFYHLLAENAETEYIAYVSEQNLLPDTTGVPVRHPQVADYFVEDEEGRYRPVFMTMLN